MSTSPNSPTERLFFGVPLTEDVQKRIVEAVGDFRSAPGRLRWIPPENWHLTLRFLGATSAAERLKLESSLPMLVPPPPFEVRLGGWDAFSRAARADVLWLGVADPSSRLSELAASLERLAQEAGFPAETRPFRPHLTIARARPAADLRPLLSSLPALDLSMPVEGFALFCSTLGKGPARYERIRYESLGSLG